MSTQGSAEGPPDQRSLWSGGEVGGVLCLHTDRLGDWECEPNGAREA